MLWVSLAKLIIMVVQLILCDDTLASFLPQLLILGYDRRDYYFILGCC